jgi:hypothetical protein
MSPEETKAYRGYGSTHEMLAGLTGHIYPADFTKSMIQFLPIRFVPALYGMATGWDFAVTRWDPFHIGGDGQEVVPPMMFHFRAIVWDATWRVNGRSDLARMDRVGEDRGTYEDWAHAVCVLASGWPNLMGRRELGIRS